MVIAGLDHPGSTAPGPNLSSAPWTLPAACLKKYNLKADRKKSCKRETEKLVHFYKEQVGQEM